MKQEIIRKLSAAVAMSLVVGVSLAACGGSSSSTAASATKTGSADGFGGAVTATLTVDANGTVTDCKLEGAQETAVSYTHLLFSRYVFAQKAYPSKKPEAQIHSV